MAIAKKKSMLQKNNVVGKRKTRNIRTPTGKKPKTTTKTKNKNKIKVKKPITRHKVIKPKQTPTNTQFLKNGLQLTVLGLSFQYGYNATALNAPSKEILDTFFPCVLISSGYNATCDVENETYRSNMMFLATLAYPLGGVFGSLFIAFIVNQFGSRNCLLMTNALSFAAATLSTLSHVFINFIVLIVGRVLIGVVAGLASGLVPIYTCDLAPLEWRGRIIVLHQLFIAIGMLTAQIIGLATMLGDATTWHYCLLLTCAPSLLPIIFHKRLPQSPRYLHITKHDVTASREVLLKLRGPHYDIKDEMKEMEAEAAIKPSKFIQFIKDKSHRVQLFTVILLMIGRQLSGIHAVLYYKAVIFTAAGIPIGHQQEIGMVCVEIIRVIITTVCFYLVERAGRRKLLLYGFGCQIFWCMVTTIFLTIMLSYDDLETVSYLPYFSVLGTTSYIVAWCFGPGPISWVIMVEFFTYSTRPFATTIACFVNWLGYLIGLGIMPYIAESIGSFVFIAFMVMSACIYIYIKLVMEDTTNKTFVQIKKHFAESAALRKKKKEAKKNKPKTDAKNKNKPKTDTKNKKKPNTKAKNKNKPKTFGKNKNKPKK